MKKKNKEVGLYFWPGEDDEGDRFELKLQAADFSSEMDSDCVTEMIPLGCSACLINSEAMMSLALRIAPLIDPARQEAAQGVFGKHRKEIRDLLHEEVPGLVSAVPSHDVTTYMKDHSEKFTDLIDRCADLARDIGEEMDAGYVHWILNDLERELRINLLDRESLTLEVARIVKEGPPASRAG